MKGLKMFGAAFVTQFDSAEVPEPAQGSFDDVACFAQAAAMQGLGIPVRRQQGADATLKDCVDVCRAAIGGVALKRVGFASGSSSSAIDRRQTVEQCHGLLAVGLIRRSGRDDQRHALGIGNDVPFAALFRAIGRIGAGVAPPKTARIEALSITARDKQSAPFFPSSRSNRRWTSGHTPAFVQSRNRRQQVTPLPQPSSPGSMFQVTPLLRTKTMPVKQARSETCGRPPCGETTRFGNRGSTSVHNSSGTNAGIDSPPCNQRRRNTKHPSWVLK